MKNAAKNQQLLRDTGTQRNILIFIALIGLALNLRSPLTSLPPIIGVMQTDLGMNSASIGLLTTIPILCFGLFTPFASKFIAKVGIDTAVAVTLFGAGSGTVDSFHWRSFRCFGRHNHPWRCINGWEYRQPHGHCP